VASADNTQFFVLFGEDNADNDFNWDDDAGCTSTFAVFAPAKNWTLMNTTGTIPEGRSGASALLYRNSIVVYGGSCTQDSSDIYRLDLDKSPPNWAKDTSTGRIPPGRSFTSAFIQSDTLFIFGGVTRAGVTLPDAYMYDLQNNVWSQANTTSPLPTERSHAATVSLQNRGFIYGGQRQGYSEVLGDAYQLVVEKACLTRGCEDCTSTDGCGWCLGNSRCVAGADAAFVFSTCNVTANYITEIDSCPQIFPSYGIALLVIGGVVVVGIIIFAIMKVRGGTDEKEGYERIH